MVWFWRVLIVFAVLNLTNIIVVGGGAGMEIVWVAIIIGSFALSFDKVLHWVFGYRIVKGLFWLGVIVFVTIESMIIGHGIKGEDTMPTDYIVVLGARVRGETPSLTLAYRLDVAYDYLVTYPDTRAILSGGQGEGESITEAEAMKRYLVQKGIAPTRLIKEDKATDTVENLRYAFAMLETEDVRPSVTVVTSRFHILRSKMIAKDLGWEVEGVGSKTLPFLIPNYYIRECFAVIEEAFVRN